MESTNAAAIYEVSGAVAVITLNRPAKRNAINPDMLRAISGALDSIRADSAVRAVILTGAGGNFSAGADIGQWGDTATPASRRRDRLLWAAVYDGLAELDRPVIAAIAGYCLGGGCELSLCCDLRIAATGARFGQPEVKVGIIPGGGATHRLARLVGLGRAKEMILLGESIDAEEAWRIGLVNRVVAPDMLLAEAQACAEKLAALPPLALALAKQVLNRTESLDTRAALDLEQVACDVLFGTEDQKEGMRAFAEKRRPQFRGE